MSTYDRSDLCAVAHALACLESGIACTTVRRSGRQPLPGDEGRKQRRRFRKLWRKQLREELRLFAILDDWYSVEFLLKESQHGRRARKLHRRHRAQLVNSSETMQRNTSKCLAELGLRMRRDDPRWRSLAREK